MSRRTHLLFFSVIVTYKKDSRLISTFKFGYKWEDYQIIH